MSIPAGEADVWTIKEQRPDGAVPSRHVDTATATVECW